VEVGFERCGRATAQYGTRAILAKRSVCYLHADPPTSLPVFERAGFARAPTINAAL